MEKRIRILWTHNFNPKVKNKGNFIYPILPYLENENVDVELFYLGDMSSPFQIIRAIYKLNKVKRNYQVIHAQYGSMCSLVSVIGGIGIPKVVSLRGSDWNIYTGKKGKASLHTYLAHFLTRVSMLFMNRILPVSKRMKNSLGSSSKFKAVVMPSAINLEVWKSKLVNQVEYSKFSILFVAQKIDSLNKGGNLLKEVSVLLKEIDSRIEVNVAENIPFKNMPAFVQKHDLLLCLSLNEGWPNSVKEALACNIPFVSTDVSDLRGIADIEETCFICKSNALDVVDKIKKSIKAPRVGLNLRRHVEFMDVNVSAKRLRELYLDLIYTKK